MSVSFVGSSYSHGGSGGDFTINKPAGVINGDLMLLMFIVGEVGPSAPTGSWTFLTNNGINSYVYYRWASGEPASYTIDNDVGDDPSAAVILAYRGARQAAPSFDWGTYYDTHFGFSSPISFVNATSLGTTQRDDKLFVAIVTTQTNGDSTVYEWPPSGFNNRGDLTNSLGFGEMTIRAADKLDVDGSIAAVTPPDRTMTHSGGSYQAFHTFSFFINPQEPTAVITGTGDLSATGWKTVPATSSMAGIGSMTTTPLVIAEAVAALEGFGDLSASFKKSTCAICRAPCTCYLSEDGFFSGTLDFDGRNFSTVEGNGSVENPYVIHFMDQNLFRPKTAEIVFDNATLAHGTTSTDVRLISGIADTGAMNYQSPIRFIITDNITGQNMFAQANYFLVGATVTFAEATDDQSNIRRITLATFVSDPALGTDETEIIIGGHSTPGGGGDPLTLSCQAFIPGLFAPLSDLSTRVTPFVLYLTQTSGGPIAVSNIKVWVTQI